MDKAAFETARLKALTEDKKRNSVGLLAEKTVHTTVKYYLEPDKSYHEVPVGRYVADVFRDGQIYEVQTSSFSKMKDKLAFFLEHYHVTVVYPIPREKKIVWINPSDGSFGKPHKSPYKGSLTDLGYEIFPFLPFLSHPNFSLIALLMDITEYRMQDGWSIDRKKGSHRFDRVPGELIDEIRFTSLEDYEKLVPDMEKKVFTANDFYRKIKSYGWKSSAYFSALRKMGFIEQVGKQGNRLLFSLAVKKTI
ncbi:MAG: hypothetical protein MJ078_06930 [Clostridia bacterium]|nr:hypothetical protein [Clostridia bacterium]